MNRFIDYMAGKHNVNCNSLPIADNEKQYKVCSNVNKKIKTALAAAAAVILAWEEVY